MHLNHEIVKWFIAKKRNIIKMWLFLFVRICHNALVDYEISGSLVRRFEKMLSEAYEMI